MYCCVTIVALDSTMLSYRMGSFQLLEFQKLLCCVEMQFRLVVIGKIFQALHGFSMVAPLRQRQILTYGHSFKLKKPFGLHGIIIRRANAHPLVRYPY